MAGLYVLHATDSGADLDVHGPYDSDKERIEAATELLRGEGSSDQDVYRLDIDAEGKPTVGAFISPDGGYLSDTFDDDDFDEEA